MPKPTRTRIVQSQSNNPWFNLALEEYLLGQVAAGEIILYLWQNHHTVVIGRNQNAWKECAWERLEEDGGKLARRLSGGGAVYHDLGNLNFTFVMDKTFYDLEKQLGLIMEALRGLGFEAAFSGRNDLLLEGRKFSGHAYYYREQAALHHGTILVHSDLEKLGSYLQPSRKKITSKGVDSVQSRVINLGDLKPTLTISEVMQSLENIFIKYWGSDIHCGSTTYEDQNTRSFVSLYEKYSSWEWRFGQSPHFDISFDERFSWGEIELGFSLKHGVIENCVVYSDAMDEGLIREIAAGLIGVRLNKQEISKKIQSLKEIHNIDLIIDDLLTWLNSLDL